MAPRTQPTHDTSCSYLEALSPSLETAAQLLWRFEHPDGDWTTAPPDDRSRARRRILIARAIDALQTAPSAFTEASLLLLYGERPVAPDRRAQVADYVEAFLEDLSTLFGDRR